MRNTADLHQHIDILFHIVETSPSKFEPIAEVTGQCSENLSIKSQGTDLVFKLGQCDRDPMSALRCPAGGRQGLAA